jgi:hypothetical protein
MNTEVDSLKAQLTDAFDRQESLQQQLDEQAVEFSDLDARVEKAEKQLKADTSPHRIYRTAAFWMVMCGEMEQSADTYATLLNESERTSGIFKDWMSKYRDQQVAGIGEFVDASRHLAHTALRVGAEQGRSRAKQRVADGGRARWAKDPKTAEKSLVKSCWDQWRGDRKRYRSKAAFSRDMLQKCEHLTSQKQIEDWCRKWEKLEVS